MAAPITHIVLSEKVFDKYFKDKNLKEFIVGTSFPDIRYLGVIDRNKTHFSNLKMEEIQRENSFMAGMMFHSFVDEIRENFVIKKGLYDHLSNSIFKTQGLKILEDKLLHIKINNWSKIVKYFEDIYPEEKEFGIEEDKIRQWHDAIKTAISKPPSDKDVRKFISLIERPNIMAEEIINIMKEAEKNELVVQTINEFYKNFETLCEKDL